MLILLLFQRSFRTLQFSSEILLMILIVSLLNRALKLHIFKLVNIECVGHISRINHHLTFFIWVNLTCIYSTKYVILYIKFVIHQTKDHVWIYISNNSPPSIFQSLSLNLTLKFFDSARTHHPHSDRFLKYSFKTNGKVFCWKESRFITLLLVQLLISYLDLLSVLVLRTRDWLVHGKWTN